MGHPSRTCSYLLVAVVTVSTSPVVDGELSTNAVRMACNIGDDCSV